MAKVIIPYKPRYPQNEIHDQLDKHRFVVLVAHRRMGKTVLAINHLIKSACTCKRTAGSFAYMAPFRTQAKQVAWAYLKRYTAPIPGLKVNEQELQVTLPNGASIRVAGADNPHALRGLYFDGVVMDEVAQMKSEVWGEVVRPALADRGGWACFIGTPRGINLFSQLFDKALDLQSKGDPDWAALVYTAEQTGAIKPDELERLKAEMSESEYRQEFFCDFTAAADNALIPIDVVREASSRVVREDECAGAPLIYGVDIARFGHDATVIFKRRGLVALEPVVVHKFDNMQVADMLAEMMAREKPDAVFIDAGQGQGVIDRLRSLRFQVTEVPFGGAAIDKEHYANRRIEMWDSMGKWLREGGCIPPSVLLQSDLCTPTYGYTLGKGLKILESKDSIKERIGRSPDLADALALTFAAPVRPTAVPRRLQRVEAYDPMAAFDSEWSRGA